jgi:hypothetical protein
VHALEMRWMVHKDLSSCLEFAPKRVTEAWLIEELRRRNVIGQVAVYDGRIVGFVIYAMTRGYVRIRAMCDRPGWLQPATRVKMLQFMKEKSLRRGVPLTIVQSDKKLQNHLWLQREGFRAFVYTRDSYEFVWGELPKAEPVLVERGAGNRISQYFAEKEDLP